MSNIIPPMVSSTPPPMDDNLDDDEDDEFGDHLENSMSYDLDGYSPTRVNTKHIWEEELKNDDCNISIFNGDSHKTNGDEKTNDILENLVLKNSYLNEKFINYEISQELSTSKVEGNDDVEVITISQQNNQDNTSQDSVISGATDSGLCSASQNSEIASPPFPNLSHKDEMITQDFASFDKPHEETTSRILDGTTHLENSFRTLPVVSSCTNEDSDSTVEHKDEENTIILSDQGEDDFGDFLEFQTNTATADKISTLEDNDNIPIVKENVENIENSLNIISYKGSLEEDCDFGDFTDFQSNNVKNDQSEIVEQSTLSTIPNYGEFQKCEDYSKGNLASEDDSDFGDFADFNTASEHFQENQTSSIDFANFENSSNFANFNDQIDTKNNSKESKTRPNSSKFNFDNDITSDDFNDFESALPINDISSPKIDSKQMCTKFSEVIEIVFPIIDSKQSDEDNVKYLNNPTLLYILENTNQSLWSKLKDLETTYALTYQWTNSTSNRNLLKALGINTFNIIFGPKGNFGVPRFASNLGSNPLEPIRAGQISTSSVNSNVPLTNLDKNILPSEKTIQPTISCDKSTFNEPTVPDPLFDWQSSGLINPLDSDGAGHSSLLDLDYFNTFDHLDTNTTSFNPCWTYNKSSQTNPSISKDLTSSIAETSHFNMPVQKLSHQHDRLSCEATRILNQLPNLNFMQAKTLLIPSEPTHTLKH